MRQQSLRRMSHRQMFQSSPGLEAGCDKEFQGFGQVTPRFNPHPAWRPGATTRLS